MGKKLPGVTLIELLVVISMILLLMSILMPTLITSRKKVRDLKAMNNLRLIAIAVNCYAADNSSLYPPSMATIGTGDDWAWQEPTMLTSLRSNNDRSHRSVSAYLRSYIGDATIMFCPNGPRKYEYLQEMWNTGDDWDNPDTFTDQDSFMGTYCFYWNYIGWLPEHKALFKGPQRPSAGQDESTILVSDYFGYGHWRNKNVYGNCNAYGSCEKFDNASVTPGTAVSSDFWSLPAENKNVNLNTIDIKLHSAYADGHVEIYQPSQVTAMQVIKNKATFEPYEYGPGVFYIPINAVPFSPAVPRNR